MALPQSALEQLSHRPTQGSPVWFGQLLMFSATIFFIAVAVFLGVKYGYQKYINGKVQQLNADIQKYAQNIPVEDQQRTIDFYAQLVNLRTLLGDHVAASQLFNWLEDNTAANVYYTKFNLNVPQRQLALGGVSRSLDDAAAQFKIFQARSEIDHYVFTNARFDSQKNTWDFDATLFFTPKFFKLSPGQVPGAGTPLPVTPPAAFSTSTPSSTPQR